METENREQRRRPDFRKIQPRAVQVEEQNLVRFRPLDDTTALPMLVEPSEASVDLARWVEHNGSLLTPRLHTCGSLLFRNFALQSVAAFQEVARALSGELLAYTERSTPRSTVEGRVFTSTEYPAGQFIQLHSEMSYAASWPRKIWFYCVQPAAWGGSTPLADNRQVYALIDPALRQLFEEKRVMYVRNYGEGLDLPWQEVFQTSDTEAVEAYCRKAGISFAWKGGGRLRTWQVRQAVVRHPETGEMLWFNQAHLFHVSSLDAEVRASLHTVVSEEDLPRNACFGDGTPIEEEMLDQVREAYRRASVRFPWQQGDLVLLDNMLVAHGRDPFVGPRSVVVAMAEGYMEAQGDARGDGRGEESAG